MPRRRYWLFKSEPDAFSLDDLRDSPEGTAHWDGVRNYQARNLLRDEIAVGDGVLFHHSNAKPPGIVGTAVVTRAGYPDHTALDPKHDGHDPRATEENPIWFMVDIRFEEAFAHKLTLQELRERPELEGLMLLQRGARLSVQPVEAVHWKAIAALARRKAP